MPVPVIRREDHHRDMHVRRRRHHAEALLGEGLLPHVLHCPGRFRCAHEPLQQIVAMRTGDCLPGYLFNRTKLPISSRRHLNRTKNCSTSTHKEMEETPILLIRQPPIALKCYYNPESRIQNTLTKIALQKILNIS